VDTGISQEKYVRQVMEAYRKTPGTIGTVGRADRLLAAQLHQRSFGEGDRKCIGAGRHASSDSFVPCDACGHYSLAGLFPAGHRGSAGDAHQPRLYFECFRHKLERTAPPR